MSGQRAERGRARRHRSASLPTNGPTDLSNANERMVATGGTTRHAGAGPGWSNVPQRR